MSLILGLPKKIAADIFTIWTKSGHIVFSLVPLDTSFCNHTWRPFFISLLRSLEFVVEEKLEVYNSEFYRQMFGYVERMKIKMSGFQITDDLFSNDWTPSRLDGSAMVSIDVSMRECFLEISCIKAVVKLIINTARNITQLKIYVHQTAQASCLTEIDIRVLEQLTDIEFGAPHDNTSPKIFKFSQLMLLHCTNLVKLVVRAPYIPEYIYIALIRNNNLTWIELGDGYDDPVAVPANVIDVCLKCHGGYLECLKITCKERDSMIQDGIRLQLDEYVERHSKDNFYCCVTDCGGKIIVLVC